MSPGAAGRMRLFRGMAVPAAVAGGVVDALRRDGVAAGKSWKMVWPGSSAGADPAGSAKGSAAETLVDEEFAVCACGDFEGAAVLRVQAQPLGRRRHADSGRVRVRVGRGGRSTVGIYCTPCFRGAAAGACGDVVERAFGQRAVAYLDDAWRMADQQRRIALCREATVDPEVVRAHAANELVLGGRNGTVFRSAFLARLPIGAGSVLEIHRPSVQFAIPAPVAVLDDLLGRRRAR